MFEREKGRGREDLTGGEYGIEIYNLNAPQLNYFSGEPGRSARDRTDPGTPTTYSM